MIRHVFRFLATGWKPIVVIAMLVAVLGGVTTAALAINSVRGGALAQPLFPADNC